MDRFVNDFYLGLHFALTFAISVVQSSQWHYLVAMKMLAMSKSQWD